MNSSIKAISTRPSRRRSAWRHATATASDVWPKITAEQLTQVREPLSWCLDIGGRLPAARLEPVLRRALLGPVDEAWDVPNWLLPHQTDAAKRIAGSLRAFGGALLCDAVGLGKTYVALSVAARYETVAVVAPAVLVPQWTQVSQRLGVPVTVYSHELLSRRGPMPHTQLVVVDEAHRFRNTDTVRYDHFSRHVSGSHLLLLTATPVVNKPRDLVGIVRLFARDNAFSLFGIGSIEDTIATRAAVHALPRAIAPIVVARSPVAAGVPGGRIPRVTDDPIVTPPPLESGVLERVLGMLDELRFPSFANGAVTDLLRLHLHHRLSSSAAACIDCLRRHRAYLGRAIEAATRGRTLSRRASHVLFGQVDASQLDLNLFFARRSPVDATAFEHEREQISFVLEVLGQRASSPKERCLQRILLCRRAMDPFHKTIVFSAAISTAHALARGIGWHRTAVVTGRGARIASGPVPIETALSLFAPAARGASAPSDRERIDVLIATDLVSEGLNLQDASAIVHYDLPWNPLRLQQRIGRVARMGSAHGRVRVWWFAPSPQLERRLRLRDRIEAKVGHQEALGVAVTSRVGQATVLGRCWEIRERSAGTIGSHPVTPGHAVVRAPLAAAFAVRWTRGGECVPDLLVVSGTPPGIVTDLPEGCRILNDLLRSPLSDAPPSPTLLRVLSDELRARVSLTGRTPASAVTKRLARLLFRRAAAAGRARRSADLTVLDAVLDELVRGTTAGGERELVSALGSTHVEDALRLWLDRWRTSAEEPPTVRLDAAIFGDGTADESR